MTKKLFIVLTFTSLLVWTACGGEKAEDKEYARIRNSGLRGEELVSALEDFSLRYPGHFDSKVDLGTYYLALGEMGRAEDHLRRAEAGATGGEHVPIMYGALGQLYLSQGNYQKALEYAEKAIEADRENTGLYRSLKGHVLVSRGEYNKALEIFDELCNDNIPGAGNNSVGRETEDLRAYLFLLAEAERSKDAAAVLERYFQTGAFFPGLGSFAATVYRAAGEMEKAPYAACLEEEYRAGYTGFDPIGEIPPDKNFFISEYFLLKELIRNENITEDQFLRYIELEPYFRLFPSYYWGLWQGTSLRYPEIRHNFTNILQKIITLDREGPFAGKAWEELTRLLGYEAEK
jgi:tetratricopeptide (TPR) repeat protein